MPPGAPPGGDQALIKEAPPPAGGKMRKMMGPIPDEATPRKIVYNAQVDLVVDEFDQAEEQLRELVRQRQGYIAGSEVSGTPGQRRKGNWTVRVPVDQLDSFVVAVVKLGELRRSHTDSRDITDEYYDVKAHIKTDEAEEEALRKLLEKAPNNKLEDLLAVRRELKEVRAQIEQQKGRLQRWDKETRLATVVVSFIDRKDYVPPVAPDFGTSIDRTFQGSIEALIAVGKGLVLVAVALAPWLMLLAILALPFVPWARRRWQRRTASVPLTTAAGAPHVPRAPEKPGP